MNQCLDGSQHPSFAQPHAACRFDRIRVHLLDSCVGVREDRRQREGKQCYEGWELAETGSEYGNVVWDALRDPNGDRESERDDPERW